MTGNPLHSAARRYLLEPGVPGVFVPAPLCALLNRLALDELRTRERGAVPELDAVLLAMRLAGVAHVDSLEKVGSGSGTSLDGRAEPAAPSTQCGVTEAATRLHMTTRAVRKAAGAGRLPGHQVDGRWLFSTSSIESFKASRRRTP